MQDFKRIVVIPESGVNELFLRPLIFEGRMSMFLGVNFSPVHV